MSAEPHQQYRGNQLGAGAVRSSFVPRRRPSFPTLVILGSLGIVTATIVAYVAAGSHAILPGVRGCELIRSTAPQSRCVIRQLRGAMEGRGTEAGLARVDRLAQEHPLVASHCHLAMHPIGEDAGERAASERRMPPAANGESTCRRGFMHGMMLGYVSRANGGDVSKALPRLCTRDQQDERNCAHVVGHLIAREAGDSNAERSISEGCVAATLKTDISAERDVTEDDEQECVRGGYMEIALTAKQPPLDTWRRRCEQSPARTREECFAWLPPLAAYRQLSQRAAAEQCASQARGSARHRDCVQGVSRVLSGSAPCRSFSDSRDTRSCFEARTTR